jgi:hypothetical protein
MNWKDLEICNKYLLGFFLATILISFSCKKEESKQSVNQTLKMNEPFQYDLGNFGDEEGATISKQATHFSVSFLEYYSNTGKIVYHYKPDSNYAGTDEVIIRSARGSDGGGSNKNDKILLTTLKFNIIKP